MEDNIFKTVERLYNTDFFKQLLEEGRRGLLWSELDPDIQHRKVERYKLYTETTTVPERKSNGQQ